MGSSGHAELQPVTEAHYLKLLGLAPGASREALDTAYYLAVENLPENPTEEDLERQERLRHAYSVLRRIYEVREQRRRFRIPREWILAGGLVVAAGALVAALLLMWPDLRLQLVHYEPGTVLRWSHARAPYAVVVSFERAHRFAAGAPTPAYRLRLVKTGETVWLSERVVEKGMRPAAEQAAALP